MKLSVAKLTLLAFVAVATSAPHGVQSASLADRKGSLLDVRQDHSVFVPNLSARNALIPRRMRDVATLRRKRQLSSDEEANEEAQDALDGVSEDDTQPEDGDESNDDGSQDNDDGSQDNGDGGSDDGDETGDDAQSNADDGDVSSDDNEDSDDGSGDQNDQTSTTDGQSSATSSTSSASTSTFASTSPSAAASQSASAASSGAADVLSSVPRMPRLLVGVATFSALLVVLL